VKNLKKGVSPMSIGNLPQLRIGDLLVKTPIIQGGMGVGISLSGLSSAVAKEGGIGVISAVGIGQFEPDFRKDCMKANKVALRKEIRKARSVSKGALGLNVMVATSDFDDMVKIAFEEEIDIVFLGAGLPLKLPKTLTVDEVREGKTKIGVIVSSARAAQIIFQYWQKSFNHVPDAVVVEGPMAGGHLGFKAEQIEDPNFKLENLLSDVLPVVEKFERHFDKEIPVIVAGGIFTGADIHKFLDLGAKGVQMATRFVATHECDASIKFKEAYLSCEKDDLKIINSPVGLPGRAIENDFLRDVEAGIKKPFNCPWKCLKTCDLKIRPIVLQSL
jgi:nitronate monooxygenase